MALIELIINLIGIGLAIAGVIIGIALIFLCKKRLQVSVLFLTIAMVVFGILQSFKILNLEITVLGELIILGIEILIFLSLIMLFQIVKKISTIDIEP